MDSWHNQLLKKYPHYHQWHSHPRHPFWHWVVFSFVTIFVFNHLSVRIGDYLNEEILSVSIQTPQALAAGNTYYVSKTGNNSNTCAQAQSVGTAKLTIAAGLACLSGGDTLVIKAGIYPEGIAYNVIPSGISDGQRTIVQGAPGETVIINGATAGYTVAIMGRDYITLDNLTIDAANATDDHAAMVVGSTGATGAPGSHYITLQNSVLRRLGGGDSLIEGFEIHGYPSGLTHHIRLNNVEVYGFGSSASTLIHGVYVNWSDSIIENSTIHDTHGGHGIHQFSSDNTNFSSNNIYRNNRIYSNGSFCIGIYSGANNLVYNNLCYSNGGGPASGYGGIRADYGSNGAKIYNNTIYQNLGPAVYVGSGASNTIVKNNIGYNNSSDSISNSGAGTASSNNLFTSPFFVNASAFDFHLQSTSPAINTGVTLAEVTTDFDGISRPQGSAYDIGAYEFGGTVTTPPPTSNCFTGNWTITNQQPSSCVPYVQNGIFAKQLPNAGNGGPLSNLAPNSDAIAQNTLTNGGTLSQQNWGNSVIATPGLSDWSGVPMYYGRISDPIYFVRSCGGNCNAQGTYWHIPNQAKASGTADAFFTVWDQTINKVLGVYSIYFRALPPCTATTQATACPIDYPSGTGAQVSDPINDRDYALSVSEGHEGNSLYNKGQSLVVRHKELMDGVINHALYLNILCFKDTSGFTSVFFPVPPDGAGLTGCSAVSSDSGDPNFRPTMGQLFFLDYTDIQINAMNLSAPQKTLLRSLVHYGAYVGDGTPEPSIYVSRFESGEAYVLNGGSPSPVYAWLEAQGIPCGTGSVTESACRYTIPVFSNVPAMTGPNCPTTGCGIEKHLHIADPCVAKGLAGMAGGCVSSAPVSTPTPTPSTSSGPIAWWKFDETSGTLAFDFSGNNITGTLVNGPVWTSGKIGNALRFDGVNDSVTLGNPAVLNFGTGSFTYSLWVNVSQSVGSFDMPWFKGGSSGTTAGYDMELGTNTWNAGVSDGVTNTLASFGNETLNQWVFLTAVVDRSALQLRVYKNGVLTGTVGIGGFGSFSSSNSAVIGGDLAFPFKGLIDDVRVYNRALSASEVQGLFNLAPAPTPSSCDLNKDSQTDILDFQLLANVILGLSPNTGGYDINKDGQVNILDTQVLANVILGKSACP